MKRAYCMIFIILFYLMACRESNPVAQNEKIIPVGRCYIIGLEIYFADSCSYKFITNFMSGFDSIAVENYLLGSDFYLYADSGDYNYWVKYFENDSTISNIINYSTSQDSLIFKIKTTGEKSTEEERQKFLRIKNLEIIKIHERQKSVFVSVPENTELKWESIFNEYAFISEVRIIGVCEES